MIAGLTVIGITGGIGSGKTTVASLLAAKGHAVIDADETAREIVRPGSPALGELAAVFGPEILDADGALKRKELAARAFSDKGQRSRLDAVMHGEILRLMRRKIDDLAESGHDRLVFLDIPLLFEAGAGMVGELDEVWVVDADEETRISRAMGRGNMSREEVMRVMGNQMSSEEKRRRAQVVIDNSGGMNELRSRVDELAGGYES